MFNWFGNLSLIKKFNLSLIILLTAMISLLTLTLASVTRNNNILQNGVSSSISVNGEAGIDTIALQRQLDNFDNTVKRIIVTGIIMTLIILILVFCLHKILNKYVKTNVESIKYMSKEISKGNFNLQPEIKDDEFGDIAKGLLEIKDSFSNFNDIMLESLDNFSSLDYKEVNKEGCYGDFLTISKNLDTVIQSNINEKNSSITILEELTKGNIDTKINCKENESVKSAIKNLQLSLLAVTDDIKLMSNSISEGKLNIKIEEGNYDNSWRRVINSLNITSETIKNIIVDTGELVNNFEEGNISYSIKNNYKGEYKTLLTKLNKINSTTMKYLESLNKVFGAIDKKDYSINLEEEIYKGDFLIIYKTLNTTIKNMNEVLNTVINSTSEMIDTVVNLKTLNIEISNGSQNQVESISEVENIVRETKEGLSSSVLLSEKTNSLTIKTKGEVVECNNQMGTMLKAMEDINNVTNKISNIISTINDIAFQTKLLALNASVEAARAGQHGKGFAVVAEEVGNLASRSQVAAEETNLLISETVNKVKVGYDVANITAKTLSSSVNEINLVTENINSISLELVKQNNDVEELSRNVDSILGISKRDLLSLNETNNLTDNLKEKVTLLEFASEGYKVKVDNNILLSDGTELKLEEPKRESIIKSVEEPKKEIIRKKVEDPKKEITRKRTEEPKKEIIRKKVEEPKKEITKKRTEEPKRAVTRKSLGEDKRVVTGNTNAPSVFVEDTEQFTKERSALEREFNKKDLGKY